MFYFFKKFLGTLLMPFPTALIAAIIGIVLLRQKRFPRLRKGGWACLVFSVLWLVVFANDGVGTSLVQLLEKEYPSIPEFSAKSVIPEKLTACRYILVLGGGVDYEKDRSAVTRLSVNSLSRLAEGIRVLRVLPDAKLVTSGGSALDGARTMAQEAESAAVSLGVEADRILRFDETRDTREEITTFKEKFGDAPVLVVTSAFHLPRAMALCRELKVNAVACPSDYWGRPMKLRVSDFLRWGLGGLNKSSICFHEWLGRLAA